MRRLLVLLALTCVSAEATDVTIGGNSYTLQSHPRVYLDGSAGTVTTRVKDPDGAGAGVAPQANDSNPAFLAMKTQTDSCVASPTYCSAANERASTVLIMALRWYMDNSKTEHLAAAKHWLGNVETWVASAHQFACDINDSYCGRSSWSDWPSLDLVSLAQAYSLIQSEMTAGEKLAFYQKMFNDDTSGYQDGCTNQLQRIDGATATFTAGSSNVTGTGLSALTAGDKVYFRPSLGFATVSSVTNDTAIVLTGAPQYSLGGNSASQTNGAIYDRNTWTDTTCGVTWLLYHHSYAPAASINRVDFSYTVSFSAVATEITVSSTAGLPSPPFYVRVATGGEAMLVTAINGLVLTVTRGQLNTTAAASQTPPKTIHYSRYVPNVGNSDYTNNLDIVKMSAALTMGLALADEGAAARAWVTRAADTWLTYTYPRNADLWTGFQQGGSTGYGAGRQLSHNYHILTALKNIPAGGSPSLDKTAGEWLQNHTNHFIYTGLPNGPSAFIPWGQDNIADTAPYYNQIWAPMQTYLLGHTSDEAKYWNYWQRSATTNYTHANLTASSNERMIPYALMFWQESDTSTDYRSVIPTQHAFNVVDGVENRGLQFWVSRQNFTDSQGTLVIAEALPTYWTEDHIGTGNPMGYRIYKNGFQMIGTGSSNGQLSGATDTGSGTSTNSILFSGVYTGAGTKTNRMDRAAAGTGWAFMRINAQAMYATSVAVTRALRHLIHFKPTGGHDYVVAFDSAATSVAKTISQNLQFDKTTGETSTMDDSTMPSLTWTGPNRRLNTYVAIPSGTGVFSTFGSGVTNFRVTPCASTNGTSCANVTSAEFLIVHKPTTNTSEIMPTITVLGTIDADFSGVQIEDASNPAVAVFAEVGLDHTDASFTTTHSGTAQYVVSGLSAGFYDVVRGVTTVLDDQEVDGSGVIAFTSVAGAFTVGEGATPPPDVEITTTCPLQSCVVGQACSTDFEYTGGTAPVVWTIEAGALCTGQTLNSGTGLVSGNPTTVQTCTFDIQVEDDEAQTDVIEDCTRAVVNPGTALTVSTVPGATGVVVKFGVSGLDTLTSCDVVVSDNEIDPNTGLSFGPVSSTTSSSGRSTRSVALGGLTEAHGHTVTITCGSIAYGSANFTTTTAVGGTISWQYRAVPSAYLQAQSAAKLTVEAAPAVGGDTISSTNASCSSGCTVTLSLTSGAVYNMRHIWKTAGDATLATTQYAPFIVP